MGFLSKIFGGSKEKAVLKKAEQVLEEVLFELLKRSGLNLSFEVKRTDDNGMLVDIFGEDEELLLEKDGQLIDSIQLFLVRVVQHRFQEDRVEISVDCNGFRDESNKALLDLAEKLRDRALDKKKSVYFRALPPKDRKVVHQFLATDGRVKSRSVGEGVYKRIKVFPVRQAETVQ